MAKFINGRWISDAELYPEQFEDLPEDAIPQKRNRSVKLSDIDECSGERRGKSPRKSVSESHAVSKSEKNTASSLDSLLGNTAPVWKKSFPAEEAVNPREFSKNEESVENIYSQKRRDTAKAYAMKIVAMGSVTEKKLRDKLIAREYSEEETEEAMEYVKSFGYINDARLAQDMLDKLAARLWGRFKICYYLKGKGISDEDIENLDFSEIDFPYHCARLMKKYTPERREAMLRAVKNAGYTSEDIRRAREILAEEE